MSAPELVAMKTYVKEYLANGFIRPSKSLSVAPVMFIKRHETYVSSGIFVGLTRFELATP